MPYADGRRQSEAQLAWHRQRSAAIRAWLEQLKLDSGCVDCGYRDNPDALQFDHVTGQKVAAVSQMVGRGWRAAATEVEKCEVRCANCHAAATARRRREGVQLASTG